MKTIKCNKTLIHGDGTESFTKGKIYNARVTEIKQNTVAINNQGEEHRLSNWSKHFTFLKN